MKSRTLKMSCCGKGKAGRMPKTRAEQVSGGVFLIGLALIFLTDFFWPGILFVIGASAVARGIVEGQEWYTVTGGLWMIGLGIVFYFGFSLPLLLILIGVSSLLGIGYKQRMEADGMDDADDYYDDDDFEKPKHKNEDLI
jgi:hypothetical protein